MPRQPASFPYPFTITCVCTTANSLFVGTYRNSDLNEPDNCIRNLDAQYQERWKHPVRFSPVRIVITADRVLALTFDIHSSSGILYCLTRDAGALLWSKKIRHIGFGTELLIHHEAVICFGDWETTSYALKNGAKLSAANVASLFPPRIHGNSVLCCTTGTLAKLSLNDLRVEWRLDGLDHVRGFGTNVEHIFVGTVKSLQVLAPDTGKLVRNVSTGVYSAILCDQDRLYFQSRHDDNEYEISCFSVSKANRLWTADAAACVEGERYPPQVGLLTEKALVVRSNVGPVYAFDTERGERTMLLSESDMPDRKFPSPISQLLILFQNRFLVQYGRALQFLPEFPLGTLGRQIVDTERESRMPQQ